MAKMTFTHHDAVKALLVRAPIQAPGMTISTLTHCDQPGDLASMNVAWESFPAYNEEGPAPRPTPSDLAFLMNKALDSLCWHGRRYLCDNTIECKQQGAWCDRDEGGGAHLGVCVCVRVCLRECACARVNARGGAHTCVCCM